MWTEERVEMAEKLWAQGHSARAIAKQLGGLTRNAVIGKMHRLGHKRSDFGQGQTFGKAASMARWGKRKLKPAPLKVRAPVVKSGPLPAEQPAPERLYKLDALVEREDAERVKLCRYIYGDPKEPTSGYCGCQAATGSSYCEAHHRLCTTAPNPSHKKIEWNWYDKRPSALVPGRRQEGVHCA
jgi:GcrA cell cycle regulator